jgi:hypothetical protein
MLESLGNRRVSEKLELGLGVMLDEEDTLLEFEKLS